MIQFYKVNNNDDITFKFLKDNDSLRDKIKLH
jgi:hypothetical protein